MADVTEKSTGKSKTGVAKLKRKNVRIDLTPMVDLGFILITFFVFTSTLARAKVLPILEPANGEPTDVCNSCVLTLILGDSNKVYFYQGNNAMNYSITGFEASGLRKILQEHRQLLLATTEKSQLQVIIKPSKKSTLKNFVNTLDEINIAVVARYFVADITNEEASIIAGSQY